MLYDIYGSLDFAVVFDDPSTGVGGSAVDAAMLQTALLMLFIGSVGKSLSSHYMYGYQMRWKDQLLYRPLSTLRPWLMLDCI